MLDDPVVGVERVWLCPRCHEQWSARDRGRQANNPVFVMQALMAAPSKPEPGETAIVVCELRPFGAPLGGHPNIFVR